MNTETKSRPILFSAPMVRAILADRKTQTRRVAPIAGLRIRHQGDGVCTWAVSFDKPVKGVLGSHSGGRFTDDQARRIIASQFNPYGQPGDRLVIRETWQYADWTEDGMPYIRYRADDALALYENTSEEWSQRLTEVWASLSDPANYAIDNRAADRRWRPAIHMPHWASRITLEITGVRVERLQDISEADAQAEGCDLVCMTPTGDDSGSAIHGPDGYAALWERINGPGSWDANPWVWVVEFERHAR